MRKLVLSICLFLGGASVFVLGSPYYSVFPTNRNQIYYAVLTVFFLVISFALKRSHSLSRYGPSAYSLFVASAALLFLSTGILNLRVGASSPMLETAVDKLSQFLHVVPVIIALTLAARNDLKSIFIARGNLKAGLVFGGLSFVAFAVVAYVMQAGTGGFPGASVSAIFFMLIFVFLNAIMEELWFRAIFLKKYQAIIGRTASILVTSAVFGTSHVFATYDFPGGGVVFGIVVFALGVVGAYSMAKTDGLIGPVLFHAGYDLLVIVPILESL